MFNDERTQAKTKWSARLNQDTQKLEIEVNDGVTYFGELSAIPGLNVQKLIDKIQKEQAEVITKTTSKMEIQLGLINITLESTQSLELMNLKAKIGDLQTQLKQLKDQMKQLKQLKNQSYWEEEDLDSKDNFDIDCIYKINSSGYSFLNTFVNTGSIYFLHGATPYYIGKSDRRTCSASWVISKILKKKI